MSAGNGRPKYDDTFIEGFSEPHVLKAPYQSVMVPRSEVIMPEDINNEMLNNNEYTSDCFNVIPTATNIAASIGYGHGPMSNTWIKHSKRGKLKGYMGQEPFFHTEGGWQITWDDAKLPEEYYADNRRAVRYVDLPENFEHWEDPLIAFPSTGKIRLTERDIVPIVPTATYEIGKPDMGVPSRPVVFKGTVSLSNISPTFEQEALPNPTHITKHIQNKNIISVLPPVYSTYIKIDDKKIPIKFKDPNYVVMQASSSESIDIPLPDGRLIKLRDYQWSVVQNVDSETELIFELPVQLRNRPDVSHSLAQLSAAFEKSVDKWDGKISDSRLNTTWSAPVIDQLRNQYIEMGNVPDLHPSKIYYSIDNALEVFPDELLPAKAALRENHRLFVQPEPATTAPWHF
jgi:hypothetical protein